jgi:hypothetical protein
MGLFFHPRQWCPSLHLILLLYKEFSRTAGLKVLVNACGQPFVPLSSQLFNIYQGFSLPLSRAIIGDESPDGGSPGAVSSLLSELPS